MTGENKGTISNHMYEPENMIHISSRVHMGLVQMHWTGYNYIDVSIIKALLKDDTGNANTCNLCMVAPKAPVGHYCVSEIGKGARSPLFRNWQ